jgi:holliday junction DNA helicase RuvA
MIGRLTGVVVDEDVDGNLCVDVRGIGYDVLTPLGTVGRLRGQTDGKEITMYIHTHVREDIFQLYGFASRDDRTVFRTLLGVSSVGPRMALSILSAFPAQELTQVIVRKEVARLTAVPGIGKKTAERLLLELRDKLGGAKKAGAGKSAAKSTAGTSAGTSFAPTQRELLTAALINMGYKGPEAELAIDKLGDQVEEAPLAELIRSALQLLMKLEMTIQ